MCCHLILQQSVIYYLLIWVFFSSFTLAENLLHGLTEIWMSCILIYICEIEILLQSHNDFMATEKNGQGTKGGNEKIILTTKHYNCHHNLLSRPCFVLFCIRFILFFIVSHGLGWCLPSFYPSFAHCMINQQKRI